MAVQYYFCTMTRRVTIVAVQQLFFSSKVVIFAGCQNRLVEFTKRKIEIIIPKAILMQLNGCQLVIEHIQLGKLS